MDIADKAPHFSGFHDLMKFRVREILMVSSSYDAFVMEEDGRLSEKLFSEYLDMQLQFVPRIQRVSSADEAFSVLKKRTYDLVITMARLKDMDPLGFGRRVRELYPEVYVVVMTYETLGSALTRRILASPDIDNLFYWSGNDKILMSVIKYVEDLGNREQDCSQGVRAILLVEDSPQMYSQLLPIVYTEIMKQTRYLISQGVNNLQRLLRMRARPKLLLAGNFEAAAETFARYRENLLGIISDVAFPKGGIADPDAGLELAALVKREMPSLPFLLYSNETRNEKRAEEIGLSFLNKTSPNLTRELSAYISGNYGFGSFVFGYPDGRTLCQASSIEEFEKVIRELPEESLVYHAKSNHFSRWFYARTEYAIAEKLEREENSCPESSGELRQYLLDCLEEYFRRTYEGNIMDFGKSKIDMESTFIKLGGGSIGGKGRGVAFFNYVLPNAGVLKKYENIKIKTPTTFVVCSEVFEEFMRENGLYDFAVGTDDEEEIDRRFLSGRVPEKIVASLRTLISEVNYPLAVRSSSILEDSQMLPFAGIYSTFMLPNNAPDPEIRLGQLLDALRLVYASVFHQSAKKYIRNSGIRIEEEKMAVLFQQLVGLAHGNLYYPVFSGVAQSYNYYPLSSSKPGEGIMSLALGFGKMIVDGGNAYRVSPAHPKSNPPYSSVGEFLQKSQNRFYALNMGGKCAGITSDQNCTYTLCDLAQAESDGVLGFVGSTYSRENDMLIDSLSSKGPRAVTFAPVLKYGLFPLPELITDFFALFKDAFGCDIEMEFSVNISQDREIEFYPLQIRPMVGGRESEEVKTDACGNANTVCRSLHSIGNGVFGDLTDLVYVDPGSFNILSTKKIAAEIGGINQGLFRENRKCVLMGFGRLGTSDPYLGIPLEWSQMSQARVVIEADLDSLQVDPSLGSHFYHNLISLNMGYLHIGKFSASEFIDWDWLKKQPVLENGEYVRHIRLGSPLTVKIDGRTNHGVIFRN